MKLPKGWYYQINRTYTIIWFENDVSGWIKVFSEEDALNKIKEDGRKAKP